MAFFSLSPSVNLSPRAALHNLQSLLNTPPPTALLPQSIFSDVERQREREGEREREKKKKTILHGTSEVGQG